MASGRPRPGWPFRNRGETSRVDPEEPALCSGLGHHGPFG